MLVECFIPKETLVEIYNSRGEILVANFVSPEMMLVRVVINCQKVDFSLKAGLKQAQLLVSKS